MIECLYRNDGRRALTAIAPALAVAPTLPAPLARRIYAAAVVAQVPLHPSQVEVAPASAALWRRLI